MSLFLKKNKIKLDLKQPALGASVWETLGVVLPKPGRSGRGSGSSEVTRDNTEACCTPQQIFCQGFLGLSFLWGIQRLCTQQGQEDTTVLGGCTQGTESIRMGIYSASMPADMWWLSCSPKGMNCAPWTQAVLEWANCCFSAPKCHRTFLWLGKGDWRRWWDGFHSVTRCTCPAGVKVMAKTLHMWLEI